MTSFSAVGVSTMIKLGRAVQRLGLMAGTGAGTSPAPASAMSDGKPAELGVSAFRPDAGRVDACWSNLPGPSRRIVVEPIEVPAQPVQVPTKAPAEPAERPEGQPVPAR